MYITVDVRHDLSSIAMRESIMQQLPMPQVSNFFYPFNTSLEEEMKRLFVDFTFDAQTTPLPSVEEVMEEFRHNGRDFEYCPDLDNGAVPETTPRRKKNKKPLPTECVFCRNNGEEETYYRQHLLKDADGRVLCPVLRAYTCPICGACGDTAHTVKYCPKSPKSPGTIATVNAFKLLRNSMGKRRIKHGLFYSLFLALRGHVLHESTLFTYKAYVKYKNYLQNLSRTKYHGLK